MLTVLTFLLVFVECVCCLLLVGAILIQKARGYGVGLSFGGGMGETLFGTQMGNILTKSTVVLAIVFLVNTTLLAVLTATKRERSVATSVIPAAPTPAPAGTPAGQPGSPSPMSTPAGDVPDMPVTPLEAPSTEPVVIPKEMSEPVVIPKDAIPEPVAVPKAN